MVDLYTKFRELDIKITIIPIECLKDINWDLDNLKNNNQLGKLQNWVMDNYVLNDLGLSFKPKSIVMTAMRHNLKHLVFNYQGKKVEDIFNVWPCSVKDTTLNVFKEFGLNIEYKYWLPSKRLAVRSGLCDYGRNNITYINGWGSLFEHASFFSDIESSDNYIWREVKCMDFCQKCNACVKACPTSAILKDRFLINPDICISNFNERGTEPLPAFIPKEAHISIVSCLHCQRVCPFNQSVLNSVNETVEFSETETKLLLKGVAIENLPNSLKTKVNSLKMSWFYDSIPRNLKALLYNAY